MAKNIKGVFDEELNDLKIDNKFVKRISQYERDFATREADHIAFLGGNLLGVYPIRFRDSDKNFWFDEVLEGDDFMLKENLFALPTVDPSHRVGSDVFNLSCIWAMNAIVKSKDVSSSKKEEALINIVMVIHYKFISSLMAWFFKYPADEKVAVATYAALSKKYALKQHGSWSALFRARAEDVIGKRGIHYNTYQRMDDDKAVEYMLSDIQTRLREVVKKMVAVFYRVRDDDSRITTSSVSKFDIDGELSVLDQVRHRTGYIRYCKDIVGDSRTFVKHELIDVVASAMHTMPDKLLLDTLQYVSNNYRARGEGRTDDFIDGVLLHAFDFIGDDSQFARSLNLTDLIGKLRAVYMASRSSDPQVLKMRDEGERFVKKAVKTKNGSVVAAVRTGLLLYVVLRTLSRQHYQG